MASTARRKKYLQLLAWSSRLWAQSDHTSTSSSLPPPLHSSPTSWLPLPPMSHGSSLPGLCRSWSLCRDMLLSQIRYPHMLTPFLSWPQFLLKYQLLTKSPLISLPTPAPLSPFVLVLVTTTTCCGCWLPGCPSWNMLLHLADSSPAPRTKLGTVRAH